MRLAAAVIVLFVLLLPGSARSAQIEPLRYENWSGGAYTNDQTGQFSHCVVQASYTSGTTLLLSVGLANNVTMGFARQDWNFQAGQTVSGDLNIDNKWFKHVTGVARLPKMISVDFAPSDPIFVELQHGFSMTVTSPLGTATYSLKGTFRALQEVQRCVERHRAGVQANPVAQKWFAANPWYNSPQYPHETQIANTVSAQITAEHRFNPTQPEFWQELDAGLVNAGLNPGHPDPHAPVPAAAAASADKKDKITTVNGTGFAVSARGHVLTNFHVVRDCVSEIHAALPGQAEIRLRLVAHDETNDLAVLVAPAPLTETVALRGKAILPGEAIIAIGYPYYGLLSTDPIVTNGIVNSLGGLADDSRFLQISAPIQPGNSGGPLLDMSGNIAGVVTQKLDALAVADAVGTLPENVNFAIKSGVVRDFLDKANVEYRVAASDTTSTAADIARGARSYTFLIWCKARIPAEK